MGLLGGRCVCRPRSELTAEGSFPSLHHGRQAVSWDIDALRK